MRECKDNWTTLLSGALWKDKKQWAQPEIQEILFKHKKDPFFNLMVVKKIEYYPERFTVSIAGDIQHPAGLH